MNIMLSVSFCFIFIPSLFCDLSNPRLSARSALSAFQSLLFSSERLEGALMKKIILGLITLLFVTGVSAQITPVVISEVFYDTPLNEDARIGEVHHNGEFIELFNADVFDVDLSGWRVVDYNSGVYRFETGTVIPARSTILLVYRCRGSNFSIRELFPEITDERNVFYHSNFVLNNTHESISLRNKEDKLVDYMSYKYDVHSPYINFWMLKAHNGETDNYSNLRSLQRKNIHASSSSISFLSSDYETAKATPLEIPSTYNLPVLSKIYEQGEIDTNLAVGTLAGNATVTPTGAAGYQIPIEVPPGTNGFQPQISIAYNSQGGFGVLGQGWDIAGTSAISRGPQNHYHDGATLRTKTIQLDLNDCLYLDGQRLIHLSGANFWNGAVYGFETENHARVKTIGTYSKTYFILSQPDGSETEYGRAVGARLTNAKNGGDDRVLVWKVNKMTDVHGNSIDYEYTRNGQYLSKIKYNGGLCELRFNYRTNTQNPKEQYITDFLISQNKLLHSIDVLYDEKVIRSYNFDYTVSDMDMRLEAISETVGGVKLNATKIGWGEESRIQRMDLGLRQDVKLSEATGSSIYTGDINGDGYPDLIELWLGGTNGHFHVYFYDKSTKNFSRNAALTQMFPFNKDDSNYLNRLTVGDINNDGKDEIIFMNRNQLEVYSYDGSGLRKIDSREIRTCFNRERAYQMLVTKIDNDEYNDIVVLHGAKENGSLSKCYNQPGYDIFFGAANGLKANSSQEQFNMYGKNFTFGDFNGDGKSDFLLAQKSGLAGTYDYTHIMVCGTGYWSFFDKDIVIPADFNGDGLTDILFQDKKNHSWSIVENRGGFITPLTKATNFHRANNVFSNERYACYVLDYNGDGLPDVIIGDETWTGKNERKAVFSHTTWYFYRNTGNGFVEEHRIEKDYKRMSKFYGTVVDMNSDGIADLLLSEGGDNTNYYYFTKHNSNKRNLVHQITNGLGQTHRFSYKNYSDYDQTATTGLIQNLKAPITVVDKHANPAGQTTTYTYTNGKIHKQKGFLGFLNIAAKNSTSNVETRTEYGIDPLYYTLQPKEQKSYVAGTLVSTTKQEYEVQTIDAARKRFISRVKNETVTDHQKNIVQSTAYKYDSSNNISQSSTKLNNETVSITDYSDYKQRNGTGIYYLPGTVKTTVKKSGSPDISAKIKYEYNSKGAVRKKTEYPETKNEIITEYGYYPTGNLHFVTQTPKDRPTQTSTYTYDSRYRFPEQVKNTLSQTAYTEYDDATGNVLSETGIDGLITKYKYNALGRLIKTIYPNKDEENYSISWSDEHGATYKTESTISSTGSKSVNYHDQLGRIIYATQTGATGEELVSRKQHNKQGQVEKAVHPTAPGEKERYTEYKYDAFGRVISETNYDGNKRLTTSYEYNGRTATINHPDRTSTTSTQDTFGRVETKTDVGGEINYKYNAAGQPVEITANGSTTRIEYDEFGRQTALHDPNAGTIRYGYYADGQIKYQVNAKGDSTKIIYDKAGRQDVKILYDKRNNTVTETKYSYKPSGDGIGQIAGIEQKIDGKIVHTQSFVYNNNHLLRSVTDRYEGNDYTFTYAYDALWRPFKTTSPSGLVTENEYDSYGNLEKVKAGATIIWEMKEQTARGQIKAFDLGSRISTTYDYYDNGLLKEQYVQNTNNKTVVQHMKYEYDPETYSLTRRNDVKNSRNETFSYDQVDRLTTTRLNGVITESITYEQNGNIKEKMDVGTYLYNPDKRPHAMTGIKSGTKGDGVSGIVQEIGYTAFNKVSYVQHSEGNNDRYEIAYGLDQQRIKTSYYANDQKQYDRYYFGTYEKEVGRNGNVTHIDYIYTPVGLTAMQVNKYSTAEIYHIHTDNIGSIQVVTALRGGVVSAEYSYNAWGGRTTVKNTSLSGDLGGFIRGYTGHEHLEPLGLINMNGRIYDPTLARFLSPDPYVQAPDFTQSFNRYAYCLNNPFKYTDPSGEFWHIVIGAVVGGVVNLAANWDNIDGFWQGLTSFVVGAGAGAATAATGGAAGAGFWAMAGVGAATSAVTSTTNSVVAQTGENFSGFNSMDWEQIGYSAATGAVAGFAGSAAGSWAANSNVLVNSINSPLARSAIASPLSSMAGHVAGGTTYNLFDGQNFGDAFNNSFDGIWRSAAIGGAVGVAATVATCYANGINPINGNRLNSSENNTVRKHGYKYDERVRSRGLQDPKSHNFPYSFDDAILSTTPINDNGYQIYKLSGNMNGIEGHFEIGIRQDGIIDHRFFRPVKR